MNVISSSDPLGGIPFLLDVALWRASSTECSTPPSYPPSFLGGSSVSSSTPPPAPPSPSHATRLRSHGTPRSPPPQRRSLGVGDGPRTRSRRLTDAAQSHRAFTKTRSRGVGTTLFVEPDEQQAALRDRLLTGVQDIAAVSNSPVNILQSNVLELVFANYTPYAHPPWIAALALVLGRYVLSLMGSVLVLTKVQGVFANQDLVQQQPPAAHAQGAAAPRRSRPPLTCPARQRRHQGLCRAR